MLRKQRDVHNGSSVVLDYSLSVRAAIVLGLLVGGALALAGVELYKQLNPLQPAISPESVSRLRNELITVKGEFAAELAAREQALLASQSCLLALEAMRLDEIRQLLGQLAEFPKFKTDSYKQPFEKLSLAVSAMAQPVNLEAGLLAKAEKCAERMQARG